MNNLQELLSLCKCGVTIYVNDYKNAYEPISYAIERTEKELEDTLEIDIKNGMIESDNFIVIDCYPFTPISSLTVYHYDIDLAIEQSIKSIKEWQEER